MIFAKAPYRIGLFGGGTDYPEWFTRHGASVISVALDHWCWAMVRWMPPFGERRHKVSWRMIEEPERIAEIKNPIVRETLLYLGFDDDRKVDVRHAGDLPARSGMGTSSAFVVALYLALRALRDPFSHPSEGVVAHSAIYIERESMGEAGGWQDQIISTFGGLRVIRFFKNSAFDVERVPLSPKDMSKLEKHLLLFYTGVKRDGDFAKLHQGTITPDNPHLSKMAGIAKEAERLFAPLDVVGIGHLLDEAWNVKRHFVDGFCDPYVHELYAAARRVGAWGGKLCGSGGGGFLLLCASPDCHPEIRQVMHGLVEVPVLFSQKGGSIVLA